MFCRIHAHFCISNVRVALLDYVSVTDVRNTVSVNVFVCDNHNNRPHLLLDMSHNGKPIDTVQFYGIAVHTHTPEYKSVFVDDSTNQIAH